MSRLRVINQPLRVSGSILDDIEDELQDYWDHKAESLAARDMREKRKLFNTEFKGVV